MSINRRWVAFPIYLLESDDGDSAIVPNDRQLETLRQQAERAKSEYATLLAQSKGAPTPNLARAGAEADYFAARLPAMQEVTEKYRNSARVLSFEVGACTYGMLVQAEEDSRDWVNGVPSTNRSRYSIKLCVGNVKLDGQILSEKDIQDLPPSIATALFTEVERLATPDAALIPFWSQNTVGVKAES